VKGRTKKGSCQERSRGGQVRWRRQSTNSYCKGRSRKSSIGATGREVEERRGKVKKEWGRKSESRKKQ
jgi:hypothetical protein